MTPGADPARRSAAHSRRPPSLSSSTSSRRRSRCAGTTRTVPASSTVSSTSGRRGSTAVVVALRADFYGHCADHPRLAAALAAHHQLLGPMQPDELRRAIEGPARAAGLRLEPGLVDTMLADVDGEPGAPPLLSHALYESWARRDGRVAHDRGLPRGRRRTRGDRTHRRGRVPGLLEREQGLMRRMFLRLTELGEGTEDTRRRVRVAELPAGGRRGRVSSVSRPRGSSSSTTARPRSRTRR